VNISHYQDVICFSTLLKVSIPENSHASYIVGYF